MTSNRLHCWFYVNNINYGFFYTLSSHRSCRMTLKSSIKLVDTRIKVNTVFSFIGLCILHFRGMNRLFAITFSFNTTLSLWIYEIHAGYIVTTLILKLCIVSQLLTTILLFYLIPNDRYSSCCMLLMWSWTGLIVTY